MRKHVNRLNRSDGEMDKGTFYFTQEGLPALNIKSEAKCVDNVSTVNGKQIHWKPQRK